METPTLLTARESPTYATTTLSFRTNATVAVEPERPSAPPIVAKLHHQRRPLIKASWCFVHQYNKHGLQGKQCRIGIASANLLNTCAKGRPLSLLSFCLTTYSQMDAKGFSRHTMFLDVLEPEPWPNALSDV
jgi:hypothetical protein